MRAFGILGSALIVALAPMSASAQPRPALRLPSIPMGQTVSATASVYPDPRPINACPVTLPFIGFIKLQGYPAATQVQYKWVRSDGTDFPTQTVTYSSIANMSINTGWKLNAATSGWIQLQVSYPQTVSSKKMTFSLTCPTPGTLKYAEAGQ